MHNVHDEKMNIYKAVAITAPKFYNSTRWIINNKLIDRESVTFLYVKGQEPFFILSINTNGIKCYFRLLKTRNFQQDLQLLNEHIPCACFCLKL
jgi:hypothetical protein